MKQIESNGKRWLFVPLSEDAIIVSTGHDYRIHAITNDITEDQAAEVVEKHYTFNDKYLDYKEASNYDTADYIDDYTNSAKDSLITMMRAHGLEGNHVILEMK